MDTDEWRHKSYKSDNDHEDGEDEGEFEVTNFKVNARECEGENPDTDRHLDDSFSREFPVVRRVDCNGSFYS